MWVFLSPFGFNFAMLMTKKKRQEVKNMKTIKQMKDEIWNDLNDCGKEEFLVAEKNNYYQTAYDLYIHVLEMRTMMNMRFGNGWGA